LQELRKFAASHLADYKVPRQIVFIKEIPKGSTGKIHRIGLAEKLKTELEAMKFRNIGEQFPQLSSLEIDILSLWQKVLGMEQIGAEDDFLSLGGDSIQASSILLTMNERYGIGFLMEDFFSAPTISALAEIIQEKIDSGK